MLLCGSLVLPLRPSLAVACGCVRFVARVAPSLPSWAVFRVLNADSLCPGAGWGRGAVRPHAHQKKMASRRMPAPTCT
eukprot:13628621-Alexandrium_andersonii.AAC.1